jgi:hypothetical protein
MKEDAGIVHFLVRTWHALGLMFFERAWLSQTNI